MYIARSIFFFSLTHLLLGMLMIVENIDIIDISIKQKNINTDISIKIEKLSISIKLPGKTNGILNAFRRHK